MKFLIDLISEQLSGAFEKAGFDAAYGRATLSNRPDLCEYQCNGALAAAKKYHKAPIQIANAVLEALGENEMFASAEAVMPGFLNLKISDEYLAAYLRGMDADAHYGVQNDPDACTIVLDYGGPNVAKPLHVGHLRSAIIGESLKRIYRFFGNHVIGDIHLGDWGLQMGLIMAQLQDKGIDIVVDATGDLLMKVLPYHPFLVKPNNHELGELFGVELKTREEVVPYARKLQEQGARNVLVSMAGEGAVLLDEKGTEHMSEAPKGKVVNAVGAGDSMVAGFVAGYQESGDYEYAFHMGLSAGRASAFSENLATAEEVKNLFNTIHKK